MSGRQGGDVSRRSPALSGKEDLNMGEDKTASKKEKAHCSKTASTDDYQP